MFGGSSGVRRPSGAMVVALFALVVAASGAAFASIPDAGDVIHGCYSHRTGGLRLIDTEAGETCSPSKETAVSWNEQGPQGPQGLQGPQGEPGPQGQPGEPGSLSSLEDLNGKSCNQNGTEPSRVRIERKFASWEVNVLCEPIDKTRVFRIVARTDCTAPSPTIVATGPLFPVDQPQNCPHDLVIHRSAADPPSYVTFRAEPYLNPDGTAFDDFLWSGDCREGLRGSTCTVDTTADRDVWVGVYVPEP